MRVGNAFNSLLRDQAALIRINPAKTWPAFQFSLARSEQAKGLEQLEQGGTLSILSCEISCSRIHISLNCRSNLSILSCEIRFLFKLFGFISTKHFQFSLARSVLRFISCLRSFFLELSILSCEIRRDTSTSPF